MIFDAIVLIISILAVIYLAACLTYWYQMRNFEKRVGKRRDAVDVLTAQKYDLLRLIGKLFVKYKISVPEEFILSKRPKFEDTLEGIQGAERAVIKTFLIRTAQTLFYYGELNELLGQNPDYIELKKSLAEVDDNYRRAVNLFNADVLGFNYWINLYIFRWISRINKWDKKEVIV